MNTQVQTTSDKWLSSALTQVLWVFGGALFLMLCSLIRFPLWFTPVPVTLQTFAVLMLGASLGSRKGAMAVLIYLGLSACHVPLFYGIVGGATSGYLLGFVLAAFVVGLAYEKKFKYPLLACVAGALIIDGAGVLWLGSLIGFKQALVVGLYPFILIDLAKALFASCMPRWKV